MRRGVVLDRWECGYLREYRGGWLLVYGRRKTGKTWLLRRCIEWSLYATVAHSGKCVIDDGSGPSIVWMDDCMRRIAGLLKRGGIVVLDEFQRLPLEYWDLLSTLHWESEGVLVACGSSMSIASRVFNRGSPLLGMFQAFHIDVAAVEDTIASLHKAGLGDRESVLWAPLARDPWILSHITPGGDPWRVLAGAASTLAPVARGLVGEVFAEEERSMTRVYDTVLQLLAEGVWRASDIAHILYNTGLSTTSSPGAATGILSVLESIGLVEGVPLWKTRKARVYYRHRSSTTSLLYRLYPLIEAGLDPGPDTVRSWYGIELQFTLAELLAKYHSLGMAYTILAGGEDVDIVLLDKGKKPRWGYEVKLGPLTKRDAEKAVKRMRSLGIPRTGLVSAFKRPPQIGDAALGPGDIVEISLHLSKTRNAQP